jgi:hypothetical protein
MTAHAIRRPIDDAPEFGGGPPSPPRFVVQRDLIERRPDGSLWSRPYCRRRTGNPLMEMLDSEWERCAPDQQPKDV